MSPQEDREPVFVEIAKKAFKKWTSFAASKDAAPPEDILSLQDSPLNEAAPSFFRHCVKESGKPANALAESFIVYKDLNPKELAPVAGDSTRKAVSWLTEKGGLPYIIIDKDSIAEVHRGRQKRVVGTIILHETGHFVQHWEDLTKMPIPALVPNGLPGANAKQEEEAWWFAMCVLAAVVGQKARKDQEQGKPEEVWRLF